MLIMENIALDAKVINHFRTTMEFMKKNNNTRKNNPQSANTKKSNSLFFIAKGVQFSNV